MSQIFVPSEIHPLKKVITHRPDNGIARVSPKRADELLFDDIVYLPKMQEEHDVFINLLACFIGKENILETQHLIEEALDHVPAAKKDIIDRIIDFEELPTLFGQKLTDLNNEDLAKVLITGHIESEDFILFDPIPNFIFTRDIAVVVNDHVIITKASKEARERENLLTRFIFWYHPMFQTLKDGNKFINLNDIDIFPPSSNGERVSIEGGDVMILNKNYLLVGTSERSTTHGFDSLKKYLFEKKVIDHVVKINIPRDRSVMHIDTVFTQINHDHIIAYKPIVVDGLSSYVEVYDKNGTERFYSSIKEFILAEINKDMKFILAGNGRSPYQEREQWTDGCNLFALKPGVAVAYDRNPFTDLAFKEAGYKIERAESVIEKTLSNPNYANELENTIIVLPSNELSRARGGSHCMTCPILRE